jgi:hypothetical protein
MWSSDKLLYKTQNQPETNSYVALTCQKNNFHVLGEIHNMSFKFENLSLYLLSMTAPNSRMNTQFASRHVVYF